MPSADDKTSTGTVGHSGCRCPVSLLLLSAALVLVGGVHAGLYLLVAPILVALTGSVASAWLLLTKIRQ
jgi:hypothetical protein